MSSAPIVFDHLGQDVEDIEPRGKYADVVERVLDNPLYLGAFKGFRADFGENCSVPDFVREKPELYEQSNECGLVIPCCIFEDRLMAIITRPHCDLACYCLISPLAGDPFQLGDWLAHGLSIADFPPS
jgi:hypothetical protein